MPNFEMEVYIPDALMSLSSEFQAPIEEFAVAAAEYVRDLYKYYIDSTGGIRSGALHGSVHVEEGTPLYSGGGTSYYSTDKSVAERYSGSGSIAERKVSRSDLNRTRVSDVRPNEHFIPEGAVINHERYVIADVPYARVYEMGWTDRGQGQDSYYGRFPAQLAIEFLLTSIESGLARDALKARLTGKRPRL